MEIANETRQYGAPSPTPGHKPVSGDSESPVVASCSRSCSDVDEARLAQFVDAAERHRPQLLWIATRITNRREEAEDIVQQALLKAYVNLSKFRGESQVTTWLRAIVQNTAREYVRNQRGKFFVPLESALPDGTCDDLDLPDPSLNPEERYEDCERREIVSGAIDRMDPGNRRVLEMCLFEELPYIQVAMYLKVSLSTVKSRMFRNKRFLREEISNSANPFA